MEAANYFLQRGGKLHCCFLDISKAFDMTRFDKLFNKMLDKGIPAIVVRSLIYGYEEQEAWVKLGGKNSS